MILFIKGRLRAICVAIKGAFLLIKTEHSIAVQVVACLLFIFLGIYFGISDQDWINQTLVMGFVLGMESLNTAIEKLADFVCSEYNDKIGFIKDIAAGAVAFSVLTALIVVSFIYYPYFFETES